MNRWKLRQVRHIVDDLGGVIAYPTESVYGLGCHPLNALAVSRLLQLKNRSWEKGLILVASDLDQVQGFVLPLSTSERERICQVDDKPTTWLVAARSDTPTWLTGQYQTLALRISRHPLVSALCDSMGHALVSSSANPSRAKPATTALKVRHYFGNQLDLILSSSAPCNKSPSRIRDLATGRILRA